MSVKIQEIGFNERSSINNLFKKCKMMIDKFYLCFYYFLPKMAPKTISFSLFNLFKKITLTFAVLHWTLVIFLVE